MARNNWESRTSSICFRPTRPCCRVFKIKVAQIMTELKSGRVYTAHMFFVNSLRPPSLRVPFLRTVWLAGFMLPFSRLYLQYQGYPPSVFRGFCVPSFFCVYRTQYTVSSTKQGGCLWYLTVIPVRENWGGMLLGLWYDHLCRGAVCGTCRWCRFGRIEGVCYWVYGMIIFVSRGLFFPRGRPLRIR